MFIIKTLVSHIIVKVPVYISALVLAIFFIQYRVRAKASGKTIIFVLDYTRFRGDIQILKTHTSIYYVNFPNWLQDKIIASIEISKINNKKTWLSNFIKYLCKATGSIGFISAGMYYKRHEVWEESTISAKKRFYCLHREGIGADEKLLISSVGPILSRARKFSGTKLMVGTYALKNLLISLNYIARDKIVVTGMPRFDNIFHYMENISPSINEENVVLFFSFFVGTIRNQDSEGLYPEHTGFRKLFDQFHSTAAQFAINNPDANIIIKMKWYSGDAKKNVDQAIKNKTDLFPNQIQNLTITDKISAQELIKKSRVVVGFNSTTLIESLLYGKKVIIPSFSEAIQEEYVNDVYYCDNKSSFYIAHSNKELMKLIERCYRGEIAPLAYKSSFIREVIGPYDGMSSKRIEKIIIDSKV
jgi:hypothetical protein